MRFAARISFPALFFCATQAIAAGGGPVDIRPETPRDPVLQGIQAAIDREDWPGARELARAAVEKKPGEADYHNLYAYALRKGPSPSMDLVFRHYNEALRLDPRHRGATEYLGEAYLMTGNLEKAREQLKRLDDLCFFSCREFTMLKAAIADYEAKSAARR